MKFRWNGPFIFINIIEEDKVIPLEWFEAHYKKTYSVFDFKETKPWWPNTMYIKFS